MNWLFLFKRYYWLLDLSSGPQNPKYFGPGCCCWGIFTLLSTFTPCCGLKNGTIFPELVSPYYPCQSIEDIEYLKSRNEIGKGCNTCS